MPRWRICALALFLGGVPLLAHDYNYEFGHIHQPGNVIVVLGPYGDEDKDGLTNVQERNLGTDPLKADTDGDGLSDGAEVNTHRTNPLKADTDGDGLNDSAEVNTHRTDPLKADTDGDGLSDSAEVNTYRTDPLKADTDSDRLSDGAEVNAHRTDPLKADTDGDGLSDGEEVNTHRTDPLKSDTDGDGLSDGEEVNSWRTNPLKADTDGDGIPDQWELYNGLNPLSSSDALQDTDGDGLTNGQEYGLRTQLWIADTDGDGLSDGAEVNTHRTDPLKADTDGDGLSDGAEVNTHRTNPQKVDTDSDGLSDGAEVNTHRTDPLKADTDGDGMPDKWEVDNGLNPLSSSDALQDTDGDGLTNGQEYGLGTNHKRADTDGDGLSDGAEVNTHRTDPLKADTDSDGLSDGAEVNTHRTDPLKAADTDGDGLSDGAEVNTHRTDPLKADTDGDGLSDGAEVNTHQTYPLNADTDGDGLSDGAEVNTHRTDPVKADTDGDGLNDSVEGAEMSTSTEFEVVTGGPYTWSIAKADATARGGRLAVFATGVQWQAFVQSMDPSVGQGWIGLTDEVSEGQWRWIDGSLPSFTDWHPGEPSGGVQYDPELRENFAHWLSAPESRRWNDAISHSVGLPSTPQLLRSARLSHYALERSITRPGTGTDPLKADSDDDGMPDKWELDNGLNPLSSSDAVQDTDDDGLTNAQEYGRRTNPRIADTDGDGLSDGEEVNTHRTNPLVADTDGDGLSDGAEVNTHRTNPLIADTDGDGLSDGAEVNTHRTNPLVADTDGDGLSDGEEVNTHRTDPLKEDTDGDGLSDGAEVNTHRTNPLVADTDGDGLSDGEEVNTRRTDPLKADTDGDGLSDGAEVNTHITNPLVADTDGDGLSDGAEASIFEVVTGGPYTWLQAKSDATARGGRLAVFATAAQWQAFVQSMDSSVGQGWIGLTDEASEGQWRWIDGSLDNFTNWYPGEPSGGYENYALWYGANASRRWNDAGGGTTLSHYALERKGTGTDPGNADTDGDGLSDGEEINTHRTDPLKADTDGDGLGDGEEINTYRTDPLKADSDGDGLSDGEEINTYRTDPLKADSDGDGLNDSAEVNTHRTDPLKADTDGDGLSDFVEGAKISTQFEVVTGGPYTWSQAKSDATARGGRLAVFATAAQWQAFVQSMDSSVGQGWIGLTDEVSEGQWRWIDGSLPSFTDWYPGEPSGGIENYALWYSAGESRRWNDAGANARLSHYALERTSILTGTGTDPLRADTDGDGLSDGEEANTHRTDPLAADTDGDGLTDGAEVNTHRTDPLKADTDDDGYSDSFEILSLKSDPFRPNDIPAFVRVANPKNPDEDGGGYDAENAGIGYVGEEYDIATTEVTNLMYAAFLNAVAKIDSLYGLYSTLMGTDASGGIIRSGSSGNYSYAVKPGFENRPVNFVSFFDTLRYINWLHNGRPTVQVQDETSTENGAYKLRGSNPRQVVRNFAAKYFLPDQDEWHKAAFFDPAPGEGLPSDSYWPYADQTTTGPGGNFSAERTAVSGTSAAASHYGTYDQGGNVWEWTETVLADERRLTSQGLKPMSPSLVTQETADLGFRVGKTVQRSQVSPLVTPALTLVGEAYNLGDDVANNRGAVSYDFQMGTYEVTNAEYAAFLNAVAMTDSFYGLYNTRMGSDALGGILRSGSNGSYLYSVKSGFANRPVNFITAFSAMRYCNWLHNGAQPGGDTESGAYRLLGNIPSNTTVLRRSAGARYYLPMEDEWYKAAFYDPSIAAMMTGNYWAYAVQSDTPSASTINFGGAFGGLSDVSTPGFPSYFGTYGQSGNAAEWTESLTGSTRIVRGGHYASATASVSYVGFIALDPSSTAANVGFRIAAARAMQNIASFAPITDKTFGDVPFDITIPESSSGLPVTVRVQSGPATISGSTVTITGAGVVVLVASQEGDWDYDAARESSASFVVAKQTQTISDFSPIPTKTVGAAPFAVGIPTASSALPVTLSVKSGPATISGNVVTLIGAGTVVLAANQPGNDNYGAAAEVLTTFTGAAGFDSEYQSWLDRHGLLSEHEQGLSDDANGDGVSNIIEFVMNRDPSSASAMEGVVPTMTSNELRITYNRRRDYALLGVQIYAETTSTLDPDEWTTSGVVERVISATETTETIEASVSMELAQEKFLRIRVVK